MSRFVVDGGVLVNKPIRPTLRAIFAQPAAGRAVRRVLVYVVPDPGLSDQNKPDKVDDAPSLGQVALRSLVTIPRKESIAWDLDELSEHNRRARGQQILRERLLDSKSKGLNARRLATELFPQYRKLRAAALIDAILALVDPGRARKAGFTDEAVRTLRWLVAEGLMPPLITSAMRSSW